MKLQGLTGVKKDGKVAAGTMDRHAEHRDQKGGLFRDIAAQKVHRDLAQGVPELRGGNRIVIHRVLPCRQRDLPDAERQMRTLDLRQRPADGPRQLNGVVMARITLLDGGMGQELIARSGADPGALWATRVMLDHPGLVRAVHEDYFAAGASLATTNTYNILHDRLQPHGLDGLYHALHLRALAEAHEARATAGRGLIAGSMGPLGESYRPDLTPPVDVASGLYAEKAQILAPHVDVILIETISSLDLARGALRGARSTDRPVWLSVSVQDRDGTRLRSGEPVAALADVLADTTADAILANCSMPEAMAAALADLRRFGLPFGAYANGFSEITPHSHGTDAPAYAARRDLTPEAYAAFALGWVDQGATLIGGCCEVGPAHIRHLHSCLLAAGHQIV